jgi:hypothetical protein
MRESDAWEKTGWEELYTRLQYVYTPLSMRKRFFFLLPALLLLSACGPSGVNVYDEDDNKVGEVVVSSADNATVYDEDDITVGKVRGSDVYDRSDNRVGRVRSDGSTIEDDDGTRVGRVRDGKICADRDSNNMGRIAEDIDDQAAAGACLLLLIR